MPKQKKGNKKPNFESHKNFKNSKEKKKTKLKKRQDIVAGKERKPSEEYRW